MCWGDPAKSLALARSRLTPEQWQRFEREFDDFCVVQGLKEPETLPAPFHHLDSLVSEGRAKFEWAKWAFFQGRQYQHATQTPHTQAPCSCPCNKYPDCGCGRQFDIAHYERIAIAMMTDEQAEQSLERWMERGE